VDIFKKIAKNRGPLGQHSKAAQGYFIFPKLEGEISNKMKFRGQEMLVWSVNNYLGLANHPEVRKADADAAAKWGLAYPMGARMMTGHTKYHEQLENELSDFMQMEDTYLLNFGYQGMVSAIDSLVDRRDVIIYDSESHACILDGSRLHQGKRFVYPHNNIENLEKQLERASKLTNKSDGGILVVTEGVFGMSGDQGKLKEILALKEKYEFRLFVDDAHGFGTIGATGRGTGEEQGVHDQIDIYFGTFAKSMAMIGGFLSGNENVIEFLRYNMRSQVFAKSMPMPLVFGALKRLELLRTKPELRENLWKIANALQKGLREAGFFLANTNTQVTPVMLNGTLAEATNITLELREKYHIFCSIVVYPVVPKGVIMLRLIPTAIHTLDDVNYTIETFNKIQKKLKSGVYSEEDEGIVAWK